MNNSVSNLDLDIAVNSIINKLTFYSPYLKKNFFLDKHKRLYPKDSEVDVLLNYLNLSSNSPTISYDFLIEKLHEAISSRIKTKTNNHNKKINNDFLKYLVEEIKIDPSFLINSDSVDFIFFHGSVGDKSFIEGTSDIDVLLGVNTSDFSSFNEFEVFIDHISKFNISLLEIDPLQHHGVMILFDYQYSNYLKSYFPEELIKFGTFLKGSVELRSIRKIEIEVNILENMKNEVVHLINSKKIIGYYHFKSILSTLLMIMIFKRQIKFNHYGFKKATLETIMSEENNTEKELLTVLTNFRSRLNYKSRISYLNHLKFVNPLYIKAAYQIESIIRFNISSDVKKFNGTKKLIQSYLNEKTIVDK